MPFYFEIFSLHILTRTCTAQMYSVALASARRLLKTLLTAVLGSDPAVSYARTLAPKKQQIINYKNTSC